MKVSELLAAGTGPLISFELFPPQGPKGELSLPRTMDDLSTLKPSFVSVTCGAGGSAHRRTLDWALMARQRMDCPVAVHQTSFGVSRDGLDQSLRELLNSGVKNVVAIRGDRPVAGPFDQAFDYASDMIAHIKAQFPELCVIAGCYPEGHVESTDRMVDLDNVKRKVDAGADVLITQLFFDNSLFFDFLGRARSRGINVPIIPGIMPIQNVDQTKRFIDMCGASIPPHLLKLLEQYKSSARAVFHIGVAHAISQSDELLKSGVPGVHFYALNKSNAAKLVVEAVRPLPK